MHDNDTLDKKLFETALRHAVEQCVEEECAPIRGEYADSPEPDYSPGFRLRMKRLLRRNKRRTGAGWQTYCKRAAAIAVVLGVGFFSVMSVEAVRVGVSNFFFSITEKGTVIDFGGSDGNVPDIPDGWDFVYAPAYLPKGYVLEKTYCFDTKISVIYTLDSEPEICFEQDRSLEGFIALDTEDAISETILIGELDGMYVEKNGSSTIFWSAEDEWFMLTTKLGREETIKIAESVEKIEK